MTLNSATSVNDIFDDLFDIFFGEGFADRNAYRRSVENIYQVPYYYFWLVNQRGTVPPNDVQPLSVDAIAWCYRLFLLREPESIGVVLSNLADFESRAKTFSKFLFSVEFLTTQVQQLKQAFPEAQRILLIHIPKTAGTSVREWVFGRVGNRVCIHDVKDVTRRFPLDFERAKQQLVICGHQTWPVWLASPQDKIFSVLREPVARAISFYKFIRKIAIDPDPRELPLFEHLPGRSFLELTQTTTWVPPSEQCHYLSTERTFLAVIGNSKVFDMSLATIDNVPGLARKLADTIGFEYTELPRYNSSEDVEFPDYSVDELVQFHENNKEDFLLYAYMSAFERRAPAMAPAEKAPEPLIVLPAAEESDPAPASPGTAVLH